MSAGPAARRGGAAVQAVTAMTAADALRSVGRSVGAANRCAASPRIATGPCPGFIALRNRRRGGETRRVYRLADASAAKVWTRGLKKRLRRSRP